MWYSMYLDEGERERPKERRDRQTTLTGSKDRKMTTRQALKQLMTDAVVDAGVFLCLVAAFAVMFTLTV
jgi:hypothetical protein